MHFFKFLMVIFPNFLELCNLFVNPIEYSHVQRYTFSFSSFGRTGIGWG